MINALDKMVENTYTYIAVMRLTKFYAAMGRRGEGW
jgi:hypothetical protein